MKEIFEKNKTIELDIEGMDCPSCALKIEKRLSKLEGIQSARVDLGSETASINLSGGEFDIVLIKKEIAQLGYKASEPETDVNEEISEREKKDARRRFKAKIITSISLSIIIVTLGMKDHIGFLSGLSFELANGLSLPLSTVVVFWCGSKFLKGFWAALKSGTADMDTLIVIGTMSAYIYSIVIMLSSIMSTLLNTKLN